METTAKSLLHVTDEPSTSVREKRKADDNGTAVEEKRPKVDDSTTTKEATVVNVGSVVMAQDDTEDGDCESTSDSWKPQNYSKYTKRFTEATIEHGTEIDATLVPQSK